MTRPLIKICGITNPSDAIAAMQAGADMLGLIFVPDTPRFVTPEKAHVIVEAVRSLNSNTQCVGVFQNASVEIIEAHLAILGLDQVQLHGDETPEFCAQLSARIIKTLLLEPDLTPSLLSARAAAYLQQENIKLLLLDLPKSNKVKNLLNLPDTLGLKQFLARFPCLLAGGLTPDNIQAVLTQFYPHGVDVSSGVEQSPGQKETEKMSRFCQIIQNFKPQPNHGDHSLCNP
jgi:phosphoribosylanthranilate isomerase